MRPRTNTVPKRHSCYQSVRYFGETLLNRGDHDRKGVTGANIMLRSMSILSIISHCGALCT
jgi:hypothetical protein